MMLLLFVLIWSHVGD